jgi:hypothetical protein
MGDKCRVHVADIVVLGDHQGIGGLGPGRTQHPLLPVAAFEQGHPERPRTRGELLARCAGDHHDLLAEAAKLLQRLVAELIEPAEDDMPALRHGGDLVHGRKPTRMDTRGGRMP